ncbi:MAG: outer membrane protein assembly factor BamB family protein [Planctomycetota bacterium]|jgi:outer membrane protein assembly factor BamB
MKKILIAILVLLVSAGSSSAQNVDRILDKIGTSRGICVVLGDTKCELAMKLAHKTELLVYVQLSQDRDVEAARRAVDAAGLYGTRVYVEKGALTKLHLADNIADAVIATGSAGGVSRAEVLRVLCPGGKALIRNKELIKPLLKGADDWSHPYHGPDNNPQSKDQVVKAPYLTQFLAEPRYAPLTQVAVASAGRVFKAFGHVAFKKREEPFLCTLAAFNGYNGTVLWKRELTPGIMVHRNTLIATPETVYLGDDKSCKIIDAATGRLKDEIKPAIEVAGGTFWKWMGLENGVLYALVGEQEQRDAVTRQQRTRHGWPWNPVSEGFNQPDGIGPGEQAYLAHPWGYGRTVLAINPKTKKVLWRHLEDKPIDSRAMCMKNGRIYVFRFDAYLACLDAKNGKQIWRKTPDNAPELFKTLGAYSNRQGWQTNWRTAAYLKCSDKALYFAGPQVGSLVAVSAEDGSVLWQDSYNNYQLVLRDDGLYGLSGQMDTEPSRKFDPLTGKILAEIKTSRRSCTRPTGSSDAIFYRARGGSARLDVASNQAHWISPMRAQCHDGVTIANGLLYWWPSTCDCQLTLYGITSLGPAGGFDFSPTATEAGRLEKSSADLTKVVPLAESSADWPMFRGNNTANVTTRAVIAENSKVQWRFNPKANFVPTAPVTAGGLIFVGGSDGIVRAFDAATGKTQWTAYTGGAIVFPPTIWKGRALVSSADGWVYALEAKTGRRLWRFRAAPQERKIPVYGSLMSTWPAASGVLVEDGVAYAAAGIVNYDGTYVYALDAESGRIKWQNNTSGHLDDQAHSGVSVQGHLLLHDDKLYMAGGTSVSPAVYDIKDGKCLNDPALLRQLTRNNLFTSLCPRGRELFLVGDKVGVSGRPFYAHPDYDVYDASVDNKMLHASSGGRDIVWLNNQKIMCFAPLSKQALNKTMPEPSSVGNSVSIWPKLDNFTDKPLWEYVCENSVAVAVSKNAVVVLKQKELVALDMQDGKVLWTAWIPQEPVPWGLAVDCDGRVIVTIKDGRVMCFGQKPSKRA